MRPDELKILGEHLALEIIVVTRDLIEGDPFPLCALVYGEGISLAG
ncbi:hypothetical protein [Acidovorax sp. SUPP3334]|nr:hypothetical protein [Acidovorax sp. SUPP3334]GKT26928.1 hypothetical protein AVHM3334_22435 [Acidovorax sp. SUPP3334]